MSELDDILRKVSALLAQANHPNTGPQEAEAFRQKAEAMMLKYRIDESNLTAEAKMAQSITVQWRTIVVCQADSEFRQNYIRLMMDCVRHFDCRTDWVRTVRREETATYYTVSDMDCVLTVCGYESDLRFIEALFTSAALAFSQRLEPKYDASLSDQMNAYLMRSAGMEGHRIAMAIYGRDDKSLRPKVRKMFALEAEARGEDPKVLLGRGSNMKVFRESYAQGFCDEFSVRLYRVKQGNDGGLVLASRKEAIDEAFYERYPERRPKPVERQIGEANPHTCAKCQKAASGYCRDHAWMKPRKHRVRYGNTAGFARGADAARTVNLGVTNRELG
jgi:hypothetical protein